MTRRGQGKNTAKAWLQAMQQLRSVEIEKYARLRNGKPMYCHASEKEIETYRKQRKRVPKEKIIFKSVADAEAYIKAAGDTGRAYECPRSKSNPKHAHITRKLTYGKT